MNAFDIFGIYMAVVVFIFFVFLISKHGIWLCKNNNAVGIIFLFLSLNIWGLILGCSMLYNARNGKYKAEVTRKIKQQKELVKEIVKKQENTK